MKDYLLITRTLATVLASAAAMLGHAGDASLISNDALGQSSWLQGTNWTIAGAPNAANHYFTSGKMMRTPQDGNNYTFGGASLTLQTPSDWANGSCLEAATAAKTLTINNFTNAGGVLRSRGGNNLAVTIDGNVFAITADSTIRADQNAWVIASPIVAGEGICLTNAITANGNNRVVYSNDNSGFKGKMFVSVNTANINNGVYFAKPESALAHPSVLTPDQIIIGANGVIRDQAGISLGANSGVTLLANGVIIPEYSTNTTLIAGPISGGFSLTKRGGGILTLSGNNTFSGGLFLYGATAGSRLNINSATALGTGTFDISNGNNALLDNTSGAALSLANNNSQAWRNSFAFLGSNSLDMGLGVVTLYGNITVAVSNNVLSVGSVFDDGVSPRVLTKTGGGTLTITGPCYYFGDTIVSEGTLNLRDSASLYSAGIVVASNATLNVSSAPGGLMLGSGAGQAQTLSGGGTILGQVTDYPGSQIYPGGNTSYGTLHIDGNLDFTYGSSVVFDLSVDPASSNNDLLVVTGDLNLAAQTTIQIAGLPSSGTYTLFKYGTLSGSVANLQVPPGYEVIENTIAHTIELHSVHLPTSLIWVGDGFANVWDVGVNPNWTGGASFYNGDTAIFDDTGSSSPPVMLDGVILPVATIVNANQDYTFTGSGIASGTLTKSGSGKLILDNDNTYAEATVINGGTLQVGNGGTTGALGAGAISNNAALVFTRAAALTVANVIEGSGTITQAGTADLTLTASNSYTGLTTVSSGRLFPNASGALGTGDSGTVVDGGQVYITTAVDHPGEPWSLSGAALRKGGASATTLGGPIGLLTDSTIDVDGGSTLNLTNASGINGSAVNANLTLAGGGNGAGNIMGPLALGTGSLTTSGGIWTIASPNSYSGRTMLTGGRLRISDPGALGVAPGAFTPDLITMEGGGLEAATDLALSDGKRGITANATVTVANSYLAVAEGSTFTIGNTISGNGSLVKSLPGTLILSGANTFTGNFRLDTGSSSADDGATRVTSAAAFGGVPAIPGTPAIFQGNNNSGRSTLQLDGSSGSITLAQEFILSCRNNAAPNIQNIAGNNTLSGRINLEVGGSLVNFQSDAGLLTLSGDQQFIGGLSGGRTYTFTGVGNILVSGAILNSTNGAPISLTKNGTGTLTLSAANTYGNTTLVNEGILLLTGSITSTGAVTVAGGTLAGNGTLNAQVSVGPAGTLSPGNGLGTFAINNDLALGGTTVIELNKAAGTKDLVAVSGAITYGGALIVENLGGTLTVGETFDVFDSATYSGDFTSIVNATGNAGIDFAFNPATGVITVIEATTPPTILFGISGNNLSLSWPASGWYAQSNSVDVANSAAWFDIPGSQNGTSLNITTDPNQPRVFYRLRK